MAAWQIPLAAQAPQIASPQQVAGQVLTLKHLAQQNQVEAEQLKAAQMANQERVRQAHDEQIMRDAYLGSNGDMAAFEKAVREKGGSPKAVMAVQQAALNMKKLYADMDESTRKATIARHDQLRGEILGFEALDEGERRANWGPWLKGVAQKGLLTPAEFAEYSQLYKEYPGANRMKALGISLAGGIQAGKEVDAAARTEALNKTAEANKAKADAQIPGLEAASAEKVRQNDATLLYNAALQGPQAYVAAKDQLPYARAKVFPDAPAETGYDPKKFADQVQGIGMTPTQRVSAESTAAHRANVESLQQQRVDLERQRMELQRTRDAAGASSDRRQAYSEITKLENQEDALNRTRLQLGEAIGAGDRYITPNGLAKPLKDAAEENNTSTQALIDDMRARYTATGPSLKRIIRDKYQQYGRLGVKATIPLEDVNAAVDAGDQQTFTQHAARQLTGAKNKSDYARIYYGLDTTLAKQFPHPDKWDEKTTPDAVRKAAGQKLPQGAPAAAGKSERKPPVNNPGNIKLDDTNFKQYGSPQEGWDDLRGDLAAKIAGKTKHGLNADSTILDLAKVYAPKGDGNNKPEDWAKNVATYLKVSPKTPIGNYASRLDELAQAVASAEGSKVPFAPAKTEQAAAVPPAAAPPPASAPADASNQPVLLKLPNGKFAQFPNRAAAEGWAKANGLTFGAPQQGGQQ